MIQIVAFLLAARNTWGATGAPNPWIFVAFMAVVAAHSGMGLLIGRVAALPIGLPLVFLLSYTWLGFAWAVPYFPLRYMAGLSLSDCCRIQYAMDYRAVATTIVFNISCFIVFLMWATMIGMQVSKRNVIRRTISSLVLMTIAVMASVAIAAPLGPYPTTARPPSDVRCEGSQPVVCLYPEQENNPNLRATIPAALQALRATGAIVPPVVEASAEATNPDRLRIGIGLRGTPEVVIQSLANGFLQPSGYAYCSDEQALLDRQNASMTIVSWLIHKMAAPETGVSPQNVGGSDDMTGSVTKILAMSEKDQGKWFNATLPALMDCSVSIELP
ncbi:hypothetical protein [Specibacter sp. NPDC078692]|uniref:DUF7224 domain-containing protein n=1 Tax=Specibacter sp. NPDC078692 TaxID=3155818 RepID=UPI003434C5AF